MELEPWQGPGRPEGEAILPLATEETLFERDRQRESETGPRLDLLTFSMRTRMPSGACSQTSGCLPMPTRSLTWFSPSVPCATASCAACSEKPNIPRSCSRTARRK